MLLLVPLTANPLIPTNWIMESVVRYDGHSGTKGIFCTRTTMFKLLLCRFCLLFSDIRKSMFAYY